MPAMMVSLSYQDEVRNTLRTGKTVVSSTVQLKKGLQAHLMLVPSDEETAVQVGKIDVRIECKPRDIPDMNRAETLAWLCGILQAVL